MWEAELRAADIEQKRLEAYTLASEELAAWEAKLSEEFEARLARLQDPEDGWEEPYDDQELREREEKVVTAKLTAAVKKVDEKHAVVVPDHDLAVAAMKKNLREKKAKEEESKATGKNELSTVGGTVTHLSSHSRNSPKDKSQGKPNDKSSAGALSATTGVTAVAACAAAAAVAADDNDDDISELEEESFGHFDELRGASTRASNSLQSVPTRRRIKEEEELGDRVSDDGDLDTVETSSSHWSGDDDEDEDDVAFAARMARRYEEEGEELYPEGVEEGEPEDEVAFCLRNLTVKVRARSNQEAIEVASVVGEMVEMVERRSLSVAYEHDLVMAAAAVRAEEFAAAELQECLNQEAAAAQALADAEDWLNQTDEVAATKASAREERRKEAEPEPVAAVAANARIQQWRKRVLELFSQLDLDNSGAVNSIEIGALLRGTAMRKLRGPVLKQRRGALVTRTVAARLKEERQAAAKAAAMLAASVKKESVLELTSEGSGQEGHGEGGGDGMSTQPSSARSSNSIGAPTPQRRRSSSIVAEGNFGATPATKGSLQSPRNPTSHVVMTANARRRSSIAVPQKLDQPSDFAQPLGRSASRRASSMQDQLGQMAAAAAAAAAAEEEEARAQADAAAEKERAEDAQVLALAESEVAKSQLTRTGAQAAPTGEAVDALFTAGLLPRPKKKKKKQQRKTEGSDGGDEVPREVVDFKEKTRTNRAGMRAPPPPPPLVALGRDNPESSSAQQKKKNKNEEAPIWPLPPPVGVPSASFGPHWGFAGGGHYSLGTRSACFAPQSWVKESPPVEPAELTTPRTTLEGEDGALVVLQRQQNQSSSFENLSPLGHSPKNRMGPLSPFGVGNPSDMNNSDGIDGDDDGNEDTSPPDLTLAVVQGSQGVADVSVFEAWVNRLFNECAAAQQAEVRAAEQGRKRAARHRRRARRAKAGVLGKTLSWVGRRAAKALRGGGAGDDDDDYDSDEEQLQQKKKKGVALLSKAKSYKLGTKDDDDDDSIDGGQGGINRRGSMRPGPAVAAAAAVSMDEEEGEEEDGEFDENGSRSGDEEEGGAGWDEEGGEYEEGEDDGEGEEYGVQEEEEEEEEEASSMLSKGRQSDRQRFNV